MFHNLSKCAPQHQDDQVSFCNLCQLCRRDRDRRRGVRHMSGERLSVLGECSPILPGVRHNTNPSRRRGVTCASVGGMPDTDDVGCGTCLVREHACSGNAT